MEGGRQGGREGGKKTEREGGMKLGEGYLYTLYSDKGHLLTKDTFLGPKCSLSNTLLTSKEQNGWCLLLGDIFIEYIFSEIFSKPKFLTLSQIDFTKVHIELHTVEFRGFYFHHLPSIGEIFGREIFLLNIAVVTASACCTVYPALFGLKNFFFSFSLSRSL